MAGVAQRGGVSSLEELTDWVHSDVGRGDGLDGGLVGVLMLLCSSCLSLAVEQGVVGRGEEDTRGRSGIVSFVSYIIVMSVPGIHWRMMYDG